MADLLGLSYARVGEIESTADVTPDEAQRYYDLAGPFLDGMTHKSPWWAYLENLIAHSAARHTVSSSKTLSVIGRHISHIDTLPMSEAENKIWFVLGSVEPDHSWLQPLRNEEIRSVQARSALGLSETEPIQSLRSLLEGCGITVSWSACEDRARSIDGLHPDVVGFVSTFPRPLILLNPQKPQVHVATARIVMASLFCSLLFDRGCNPSLGRSWVSMVHTIHRPSSSMSATETWRSFVGYHHAQKRARQFARWFLAPRRAIENLLTSENPLTPDSVVLVAEAFGIPISQAACSVVDIYGDGNSDYSHLHRSGTKSCLSEYSAGHRDAPPR